MTVAWTKRVVAVSDAVQQSVCARLGLAQSRVPVIPNGLDLSAYEDLPALPRTDLAVPDDVVLVGCVGRIVASKGYDALLQALTRPELSKVHLLMVGEGPDQQSLQDMARELGVFERTTWLGLRRDVPAILATLDVFAMPSHWEGHCIALLEAMAAGCALLVSDLPEITETTQDAAIRVTPGSPDSIARGLRELLEVGCRRQSGARARQQVQRFSIERSAQAYQTLYNEVLGTTRPRPENA